MSLCLNRIYQLDKYNEYAPVQKNERFVMCTYDEIQYTFFFFTYGAYFFFQMSNEGFIMP